MTAPDVADWLAAARHPAIVRDLESIYASTAAAIAQRAPACWASGRCCNFDRAGHRLYVTALETAYCVARLIDSQSAPADDSASSPPAPSGRGGSPREPGRALSLTTLSAARAAGGCPFQSANLCTVHTIKPLACRVYFCDRSVQGWQHDLSERMHERIRALHDAHAIEYRYAEWRTLLELFL